MDLTFLTLLDFFRPEDGAVSGLMPKAAQGVEEASKSLLTWTRRGAIQEARGIRESWSSKLAL